MAPQLRFLKCVWLKAVFVPADEVFERLGEALCGVEGRPRSHRGPFATDSGDYDLLKTQLEELLIQN